MKIEDICEHLAEFFAESHKGRKVIDILFDRIFKYFNCEAGTLYIREGKTVKGIVVRGPKMKLLESFTIPLGKGIVGTVLKSGNPVLTNRTSQNSSFDPFIDKYTKFMTRQLLCVPMKVSGKITGCIELINKKNGLFNKKDLQHLVFLSNTTALFIDHKRLYEKEIRTRILQHEMKLAREIQSAVLPESLLTIPGYDIKGRTQPAGQVGGDFFDCVSLDKNRFGIIIGDVSGKNLSASIFMQMARMAVISKSTATRSPVQTLRAANKLICRDSTKSGMFVTVFYGILDTRKSSITYSCAGHNQCLLYRKRIRKFIELYTKGAALGVFEDIELKEKKIRLDVNDSAYFFSDGLFESANSNNKLFGYARLQQYLGKVNHLPVENILDKTLERITNYSRKRLLDDLTLIVLRRNE